MCLQTFKHSGENKRASSNKGLETKPFKGV
jgi:hypothetical protein